MDPLGQFRATLFAMAACDLRLRRLAASATIILLVNSASTATGVYFPPPGSAIENQERRQPGEVGLDGAIVKRINAFIATHPYRRRREEPRWALWRHGRLVHVEGDFNKTVDVASLRKTWHAMIVGAAIQQRRIPSYHQKLSTWLPQLRGRDADATWRHVITQSAGFDYPYGKHPDYRPGKMWTYSDWNLVHLCDALAKVYERKDYHDAYEKVAGTAFFDVIGMRGWSTRIKVDGAFGRDDGVRFKLSLEHMGRLGLFALARGRWNGQQLVPQWFVEELETKQTYGMKVNYEGPNDGQIGLRNFPGRFQESPYGYLTWVNTEGDYFPGADRAWAWGSGAGGTRVLWNRHNGIVFAGVAVEMSPSNRSIPHLIEQSIQVPDPLAERTEPATTIQVGQWDRFETSIDNATEYADPYRDVMLSVRYLPPDGSRVDFWGFHDGGSRWRIRFMPDQLGTWRYQATFSDGSPGRSGAFECVPSNLPGMISRYARNPIWFGFRGGGPLLIRSLHVGDRFFASNWDDPTDDFDGNERTAFLTWAQQQGYNTLSVASHYLNRSAAGRGEGWDTPDLWPLCVAEFRRLEAMLDALARRRIIVFPFAGFFGRGSDFPRDPADQRTYIQYTLARLAPYWSILLSVGGPEPHLRGRPYLARDEIMRLGETIARLDPFGHLLTVHNPTGDDHFKDADWLTYGTLQGPKTRDRAKLSAGLLRNHHPAKPLYAQETLWGGNVNHPHYREEDLRKNAFVILMSAAALNFGDMEGNSSSGFSGSLKLADRHQRWHDIVAEVWDFFETIPFHRMKPRQDLVDRGYCLAEAGRAYLVYLEDKGKVNVEARGGPFRVTWINAQNTHDRRSGGTTPDGSELTSPSDADDWLVYLTRP